jgi:hypothetical protein
MTTAARVLIAAVSGALAAGALLSPAAQAITDTVFRYSTPKTGSFMVPAAALSRAADGVAYSNNGFSVTTSHSAQVCFQAPVNVPHGAELTSLTAWYGRADANAVVFVLLRRMQVTGVSYVDVDQIANTAETQAPVNDGFSAVRYDITDPTVNNRAYAYYIVVCLANNGAFNAARVDYTYTTAGD